MIIYVKTSYELIWSKKNEFAKPVSFLALTVAELSLFVISNLHRL